MSSSEIEVAVPSFGHGLDEALLVEWNVDVGVRVARGDVVATVETDKASVEVVAERAGIIDERLAAERAIVKTGEPLYRLTPIDWEE
ncbi:lipoyl domain-containing protein [Nocardia sp. NPDC052566]|uniref:lipoyl domain-containing protein n=1 Tax=Nocardia sp. NPDC052566 TaxID=3364330 RepID=UPI0037C73176